MREKEKYEKLMEMLLLLASILLIVGVTIEIVSGDRSHFSEWFLALQLIVCLMFTINFLVGFCSSSNRSRYMRHNILFLLLSIPYLNIITWLLPHLDQTTFLIAGAIPVIRSLLAISIILRWTIRDNSAKSLFFAYILAVCLFTHLAALILYYVEYGLNPDIHNFGDAIWWAWMGLSTAGSQIIPTTTICRILGAILPIMGMMILPIFTGYILTLEKLRRMN